MSQNDNLNSQASASGNLATNALLANLKLSTWSNRKLDKKLSRDLENNNQATTGAASVSKHLVARSHASYKAVLYAAGKIRTYHYQNTLPWLDRGARILPAPHYMNYVTEMRALIHEFETKVTDFVTDYPQIVANAPAFLGALYNPNDFPPVAKLQSCFYAVLDFIPLQDSGDIRCNLGNAIAIEEIKSQAETRARQALADCTHDLASRLLNQVQKIAEYGKRDKAKLPKQTMDNLQELLSLVPSLNFTGSPEIQAMCDRIARELSDTGQAPQDAAKKAEAIYDDLSAFMGTLSPSQKESECD